MVLPAVDTPLAGKGRDHIKIEEPEPTPQLKDKGKGKAKEETPLAGPSDPAYCNRLSQ